MRLNRYLASAGLGSRRSCEDLIRTGRVTVNGKLVTDLATTVGENDHVSVDGKKQKPDQPYTLAMFKPEGVLCSRDAQGRRKTVFDLLPEDAPRLFYVGRLDMDSEGLLILTNRGELAQQLAHPSFKLPKVYHVELDKDFDFALVPRFLKGFLIEHGYAKAEAVYKLGHNRVKVVLTQGLKRQIRLMFLKFGYRVKFLRRIEVGSLSLGNMKVGEWRFLNDYEVKKLLLAPVVRDEEAPKTFGKGRDLSKISETPPLVKKVRIPVAERFGRKTRTPSFARPSRPLRSAHFEKKERPEKVGRPQRSGRLERPAGSTRFSRPGKPAFRGGPPKAESSGRTSRPASVGRFSRSNKVGQDRPKRFERPEGTAPRKRGSAGPRPSRPAFGRAAPRPSPRPRPDARGSARPQGKPSRSPRR